MARFDGGVTQEGSAMSGPKISVYELNGRARRVVLDQIRCEQQCFACAEQIKDMLSQASSYRLQLENLAVSSELMASRGIAPAIGKERLTELISKLEDGCKDLRDKLDAYHPQISAKYTISDKALAEKKAELKRMKALRKQASELRNTMDAAVSSGERERVEASEKIKQSIAEDLTDFVSFGDLETSYDESPEIALSNMKDAAERRLTALMHASGLSPVLRTEVQWAIHSVARISSAENMRTFNIVTINSLEKKIAEYVQGEEIRRAEYAEDVSRYLTLCAMLEREETPAEYSPKAAEDIKAEIEQMELLLVRQHEQTYISECVDEVMTEMGYNLIGTRDVKKRSGKRFRNELFTFNEGTAVNVTYSSDGQIAMELGGIAREDRLPTAEETDALTKDMVTFCGEFEEFERRLSAKGIVLGSRIALFPPSAEYAAIINVSDYDVEADRQISEINAGDKRRGKVVEKKVLRRDE